MGRAGIEVIRNLSELGARFADGVELSHEEVEHLRMNSASAEWSQLKDTRRRTLGKGRAEKCRAAIGPAASTAEKLDAIIELMLLREGY